jgi:hypothetical protein
MHVVQHYNGSEVVIPTAKPLSDAPSASRPFAAGKIGNGDQRSPIVGGASIQARWHFWIGGSQFASMIENPAASLALEFIQMFRASRPQWLNVVVREHSLKRDID